MYSVTKICGKGIGCIATQKIGKGALILREKPCIQFEEDMTVYSIGINMKTVIQENVQGCG